MLNKKPAPATVEKQMSMSKKSISEKSMSKKSAGKKSQSSSKQQNKIALTQFNQKNQEPEVIADKVVEVTIQSGSPTDSEHDEELHPVDDNARDTRVLQETLRASLIENCLDMTED